MNKITLDTESITKITTADGSERHINGLRIPSDKWSEVPPFRISDSDLQNEQIADIQTLQKGSVVYITSKTAPVMFSFPYRVAKIIEMTNRRKYFQGLKFRLDPIKSARNSVDLYQESPSEFAITFGHKLPEFSAMIHYVPDELLAYAFDVEHKIAAYKL
jgi:hypothetical protein